MRLRHLVLALGLLWISGASMARADDGTSVDSTPVPVATQPPIVIEPTQPAVDVPTIAPPPVTENTPIVVAPEHSTPIVHVSEPDVVPTAVENSNPGVPQDTNPLQPSRPSSLETGNLSHGPSSGAVSPSTSGQPLPPEANPLAPSTVASAPGDTALNFNYDPRSAAAPAQLSCDASKTYPVSQPFLVAPYSGWTEVASFLDHDSPDYALDGRIVLANGLTATTADGQESDLFPAYWSPDLRQFINYDGHNGYDLDISYQPVLAAGAGVVKYAGWNEGSQYGGYGQMILIDHQNGYVTLYGHLSELDVKKGQKIAAGQQIAISGSTGHSSGPHLHFTVFHNCNVVDPYGWTGSGKDPLETFDGERSQYLWLPGHDPLILNPPPHWPAYPTGLKLNLPPQIVAAGLSSRQVPVADRLLLLKLPSGTSRNPVSAAVALARTEARLTREIENLGPSLEQLKRAGLIVSYQSVPAAAAIWVRGTANAGQLESLPGVASLAGMQPHDLAAAQAELAHAVLIQLDTQGAPTLWPAGFRSALHAWRPVATGAVGHSLVTGAALPGQRVTVTVWRKSGRVEAAEAYGDAETGGFVAMLRDTHGTPIELQAGDRLQVASDGRSVTTAVPDLQVRARARSIKGVAGPGATVPVSVMQSDGSLTWHTVATADSTGKFSLRPPFVLAAGSMVIVSQSNAAGNQQAVTGFVPGLRLFAGTPRVTGWTVGWKPYLELRRGGKVIDRRAVHPAPDGTFDISLRKNGNPEYLQAGDAVSIGSRQHRHAVTVPVLSLHLTDGSRAARVFGVPESRIDLRYQRPGRATFQRTIRLDRHGRATLGLPHAAAPGDQLTAVATLGGIDQAIAQTGLRSLTLGWGDGSVRGVMPPGTEITVGLSTRKHYPIGATVAGSDPVSGAVTGRIVSPIGAAVSISGAASLSISDDSGTRTIPLPHMTVKLDRTGKALAGHVPFARAVTLQVWGPKGVATVRPTVDRSGNLHYPIADPSKTHKVALDYELAPGIVLTRKVSLVLHAHRAKSRHQGAPRHKGKTP